MCQVIRIAMVLCALTAMVGCDKKEDGGKAATAGSAGPSGGGTLDMATARTEFNSRCSSCHGEAGKGNGPAATALNPKPRDYTSATWQKSVTDEDIKKTIVLGGAAVGKSPIMPASPDLDSKPEVLNGLVAVVRSFNGK